MCCPPPDERDPVAAVDPELPGLLEAYKRMKQGKVELEEQAKDKTFAREIQKLQTEMDLRILEKDAEMERRVKEAKALSGLPLAVLAFVATDPGQRSVLLEFEKWIRAEGLTPGKLAALTTQGTAGQDALAKYTEALYKGLAQVIQAAPSGGIPPDLRALLERLAKEGI